MNEIVHCGEWIVSTLEGDTGIGGLMAPGNEMISGAYMDLIPDDRPLPAIRFHVQMPHDVRGAANGAHRIMTRLDWLVAVVREGHGLAPILPIADRVDAVLQEANGETSTIRVLSCVRMEPFELLEPQTESGVRYRHVGGIYRMMVQSK